MNVGRHGTSDGILMESRLGGRPVPGFPSSRIKTNGKQKIANQRKFAFTMLLKYKFNVAAPAGEAVRPLVSVSFYRIG